MQFNLNSTKGYIIVYTNDVSLINISKKKHSLNRVHYVGY